MRMALLDASASLADASMRGPELFGGRGAFRKASARSNDRVPEVRRECLDRTLPLEANVLAASQRYFDQISFDASDRKPAC